ncbi:MAG: bifunctional salicylyl-CoA 5-hydroxylase/oxidoreductase [Candidatus Eremiobacteraeota bacterium]|nr:bifunctional salicylyl-CoA 5-hydroxylase/oxidoreductase [Candidatus Eremiobacteraeota bacterium]MBV8375046.1 bifunctional salicylyl-CoA 5-hydroxylase/oxidoreductase [Candidatus Eremiobacteraeota bacterium]
MRITCIGGGPAGLYFSILAKQRHPGWTIRVIERNRPHDTFGWGVVFSDATLDNLREADEPTHRSITDAFAHWDDIDVHFKGRTISSGGHGFSGISRKRLLGILQDRATALGVDLQFEADVADLDGYRDCDLLVGADGANSRVRNAYADAFEPNLDLRLCRYVWLGTTLPIDAFTFVFEQTEHGWFTVHAYRFDDRLSTFIVECREETWRAHGLESASTEQTLAFCEGLFSPYLRGHRLMANSAHLRGRDWLNFTRVTNQHWVKDRVVLLGDAAHTAHFSVGSGTKLAMEDAIGLADALSSPRVTLSLSKGELAGALSEYEASRKVEVLKLQNAARNSTEWFENVARYANLPAEQFAYSLLTRSQRIGHENLRLRDTTYVEAVERWFAGDNALGRAGAVPPVPPMFTPIALRSLELRNRVVVSPMDMYSAVDGFPNDFHLVHLGTRALGGAGLLFTEMTCVTSEGRISPGCTGMYHDEHVPAWKRIVHFVHEFTSAKICLQLGHSGPKGSTKLMWEGMDEPLSEGNWPVVGPSAIRYAPLNQLPRELDAEEMNAIREAFVRAARMGLEAGFDMLELHCAHGYLLSSFITPLLNRRTDAYGGSLENRLRYPLEVFRAVREVWPQERPISVRISATDWIDGGISGADSVEIARAFKAAGADLIDVSTGQTSPDAQPVYGRMFQTPYADRIRNEIGIATMAVGNITDADQVNAILAAGRADLVALGRPHLADPFWTLHAAARLGYGEAGWPVQYLPGKQQLERLLERERAGNV